MIYSLVNTIDKFDTTIEIMPDPFYGNNDLINIEGEYMRIVEKLGKGLYSVVRGVNPTYPQKHIAAAIVKPSISTIKEKIDKLCRDAWQVGRTEVDEINLFDDEVAQLGEEFRYQGTGRIAEMVNPVTGSLITINIMPRETAFDKWWNSPDGKSLRDPDKWTFKECLRNVFMAGQRAQEK